MKKINNSDGSYVIIHYFDIQNKEVEDVSLAFSGVICEFDKFNNLINETNFIRKTNNEIESNQKFHI